MTWEQLFTLATPEERFQIAVHMLRAIEARQNKLLISRGRLIYERRRSFRGAHFINNKRGRFAWSRVIIPLTFIVTLLTVSISVLLAIIHVPSHISAPILFFYLTSLLAVIAFRPKRLALQT